MWMYRGHTGRVRHLSISVPAPISGFREPISELYSATTNHQRRRLWRLVCASVVLTLPCTCGARHWAATDAQLRDAVGQRPLERILNAPYAASTARAPHRSSGMLRDPTLMHCVISCGPATRTAANAAAAQSHSACARAVAHGHYICYTIAFTPPPLHTEPAR
ncbi:hypothetical protein B0H16DRAFT_1890282 [Mycena metata]|uniref:Uncharacterized protein n=1 Tax=Mycena metata TaxID=1033252 RepID=A0AAD7HZS2_9AGAR|nr:hypothetical protein B0H16DRAFT_1582318 [Mycena metata]KAJ7742223.1 hypothetical protein B0H16DRAFT_1890282 [Mycena metata]